jgi:hypothetical protein
MKRAYYNEPLKAPRGDYVPRLAATKVRTLNATVRTRLALERELRLCGLTKPESSALMTAAARQVLVTMLREVDSPLSASLRARAAAMAGKLGLKRAAGVLRRIALDEGEDLATRFGAVTSYLEIAGAVATADLETLLASRCWQVRATAFAYALGNPSERLRAIGERRWKRERNGRVKQYVARRLNTVRVTGSTAEDSD